MRPAFAVTFKDEVSIVGDHIAIDISNTALGHLVGQQVQGPQWTGGPLGPALIRKLPSGQIGIATSHQNHVAGDPAKFVGRGRAFNGRSKLEIGTQSDKGCCRREQFGV